jgi:sortase A
VQPETRAWRLAAGALGRLLVAGGSALLLVWGAASGHSFFGSRSDRVSLAGLPAMPASEHARTHALPIPSDPDTREWSPQRVAEWAAARLASEAPPLALLEIPRAGIAVAVLDGTGALALNRGVGRIAGTAGVADAGNLGIAGHRDGFFRALRHVRAGDAIRLVAPGGERRYRVEWTRVVAPGDVSVLAPTDHAALTLVTCHPFWFVGPAPERFIVRARAEDEVVASAAPRAAARMLLPAEVEEDSP